MEIILLAAWAIWIVRNNKMLRNQAPHLDSWRSIYKEVRLVSHKISRKYAQHFKDWRHQLE
jgi:hypothetical protein